MKHLKNNLEQTCVCSSHLLQSEFEKQIDGFYQLRKSCPALQLTISDKILEQHIAFTKSPPDASHHSSVPFLAYRRGLLGDFTKSLHRFVIGKEITNQYKSDLQETWVLESDEISRFNKFRNYQSRLAELDFAKWLEAEKWEISNLEAYGGLFDVEANSSTQEVVNFEVKFLAQREIVFELIRNSFTNPTVARLGVYSPVDYLLFRLYEAAQQLKDSTAHSIAVAIVEDYQLSFKTILSEIDWNNPQFLKRDSEISAFLEEKYKENSNLNADLITAIKSLDEIWILRYNNNFELELCIDFKLHPNSKT